MEISILPNTYRNSDGTFNMNSSLKLCGQIAGVCYSKHGFSSLEKESEDKTLNRIETTLNNGHHSVYDHVNVTLNIKNIPKILAMVLNNEHQYTTSEKSLRYTEAIDGMSNKEIELYNKWTNILEEKIKKRYPTFDDKHITKLARENARYFISVFYPTEMIYTTSIRQLNFIVSVMKKYISQAQSENSLKLAKSMEEFISLLDKLGLLEERLQGNIKNRSLSLFGTNLKECNEYYSWVYSTKYIGSLASFAQAQRHRTIDYKIEFSNEGYFVPPIIMDDENLVHEWNKDMESVDSLLPQGKNVIICEMGTYDNFLLKCSERLCTNAQLEIMVQTKEVLTKYINALKEANSSLYEEFNSYSKGARCTFGYTCSKPCKFSEGITLVRKI